MEVLSVPISSLIPDPSNARKHNQKNLDAIKGSLAKFGQQKPIVVGKDNVVIAGNGQLEAAKALGWEKIKIVRTKLTGAEAIAYAVADNRAGELAEWDMDVLGQTLRSLEEDDFGISDIGFDLIDFMNSEPNYGVLDEGETQDIDDMKNEVRKALQIEFELEHYDEASELVKFWRSQGAYIGMMLIDKLRAEKARL